MNQFELFTIAKVCVLSIGVAAFAMTFAETSLPQRKLTEKRDFCNVPRALLLQQLEELNQTISIARFQIYKAKSSAEIASVRLDHVRSVSQIHVTLNQLEGADHELVNAERQSQFGLRTVRRCLNPD